MGKIGVFETPPRKRFVFDQDTEVELEFISKDRMNKLLKKASEAAAKLKTPQNLIYDIFLGKAAVHGWWHTDQEKNPGHPGLVLPGGAPLLLTGENRNMLMEKCAEFSSFVFQNATSSAMFLDEESVDEDSPTLGDLLDDFTLDEDAEPKND